MNPLLGLSWIVRKAYLKQRENAMCGTPRENHASRSRGENRRRGFVGRNRAVGFLTDYERICLTHKIYVSYKESCPEIKPILKELETEYELARQLKHLLYNSMNTGANP